MSNHLHIFELGPLVARMLVTVLTDQTIVRLYVNRSEYLISSPEELAVWFSNVFRTAPPQLPICLLAKSPGYAFDRLYSPLIAGL